MYLYKPTRMITAEFSKTGLTYNVFPGTSNNIEYVRLDFEVPKGPELHVDFISSDDNYDINVIIPKIICNLDYIEELRVLRIINQINATTRYGKFSIYGHAVYLEYDLPVKLNDDCVGPCAVEAFFRLAGIIKDKYKELVKPIWGGSDDDEDEDDAQSLNSDEIDSDSEDEMMGSSDVPDGSPFQDDDEDKDDDETNDFNLSEDEIQELFEAARRAMNESEDDEDGHKDD